MPTGATSIVTHPAGSRIARSRVLTPRTCYGWRSLGHELLEPLTFLVTVGAPSKRSRPLHRLARAPSITVKRTRCRCVDLDNQDRADAARVRSDAALDPERLPSYRVLTEKLRESDSLARLFTRGLETRAPVRPFGAPRHLVKSASVPRELDSPSTRAFRRRVTHEPEMRPADVCNLRFQR